MFMLLCSYHLAQKAAQIRHLLTFNFKPKILQCSTKHLQRYFERQCNFTHMHLLIFTFRVKIWVSKENKKLVWRSRFDKSQIVKLGELFNAGSNVINFNCMMQVNRYEFYVQIRLIVGQ